MEITGRERVLAEAAALFLDRGYAETSLRDIAAAAGMKAGSVYYHFDSKDDLLTAVLDRGIELISDRFDAVAAATDTGEGRARFRAHLYAHLECLHAAGPYTAAHVTVFYTAPEDIRRAATPSRNRYEKRWADLFHELVESGHLSPDIDLSLHRVLMMGAANSTLDWFDPDGAADLDAVADALTAQFFDGVGGAA